MKKSLVTEVLHLLNSTHSKTNTHFSPGGIAMKPVTGTMHMQGSLEPVDGTGVAGEFASGGPHHM